MAPFITVLKRYRSIEVDYLVPRRFQFRELPLPKTGTGKILKRELREELSIDINDVDRTESQVNRYDDGGVFEVTYCYVSRFAGVPTNNTFEQIRWVTITELKALDILEGNKSVVANLSESLFG